MKNIVVIPNETKDCGLNITKRIVAYLSKKALVYMDNSFLQKIDGAVFCDSENLFDNADCVIVLGGDGTILRAAEQCGRKSIPIMGINLGRVGFMTEVKVDEATEACDALLGGHYNVEKRMMMGVTVIKNGSVAYCCHALNDVVVAKDMASMILIKMYSENEKINQYKADGLIISTPTGSTGYSLSAGGPVVDPLTELFVAAPICAHELHARPAVLSVSKPIVLMLDEELGHDATVTVDGTQREKITIGDKVIVEKSDYSVDIIKIGKQSFYDVLIEKLR